MHLYFSLYQPVSYLKDLKLKSLEMRLFMDEFRMAELPERMPDWARVYDNDSSSDGEFQTDQREAQEAGNILLHLATLYSPVAVPEVQCSEQRNSELIKVLRRLKVTGDLQ